MNPWPKHPVLYEINTWVWLQQLSRRHGCPITLAAVPAEEWDALAALGVDAVWLMGVWERSPGGVQVVLRNEGLLADFHRALPDFEPADVVGSPYCVRRYVVDEHLGGPQGLAAARQALRQRGLRLILDFVPNHVAPDHPWATEHPEYFVRDSGEDLQADPAPAWRTRASSRAIASACRSSSVVGRRSRPTRRWRTSTAACCGRAPTRLSVRASGGCAGAAAGRTT